MCVYKSINAVSASLAETGIAKGRKNQQQGYSFRGIDEVLNALAPLLAKHHLVIAPRIMERSATERPSKSGGITFSVVVRAEFDFIDATDGSKHTVATYGEAMDSADKATNKAMSAAYKYAAFLTFCIPVEGMADDADLHSPEPVYHAPVQHHPAAPPSMTPPQRDAPAPVATPAPVANLSPEAIAARDAMTKATASLIGKIGEDEARHQIDAIKTTNGKEWRKSLAAVQALDASIPARGDK